MLFLLIAVYTTACLGNVGLPMITSKPDLDHFGLQKRVFTSICGYGINDPTYSFVCDGGYLCGFNPTSKAFGCCASASGNSVYGCYFPTTCYDYGKLTVIPTGSSADFTYSCSDIAYPYCATIIESGLTNFDCNKAMSQTAYLSYVSNLTSPITSTSSISSMSSISTVSSPVSVTASSTSTSSTSVNSVAVVGSTSTAPTFSRTQMTGSATATTTTSSGYRSHEVSFWAPGIMGCLAILAVWL